MNLKRIPRILMILAVVGSNIGCDQIAKNMAHEKLEYHEEISLADSYVTLIKVKNALKSRLDDVYKDSKRKRIEKIIKKVGGG